MAGYNLTRSTEDLLERTESSPPSFTIHLHPEYWTLNNGSKFLYNNQVASLLDDIRAHRIPVDFLELFDSARVPFYDGCMIVELLDYRPQRNKEPPLEKPDRSRVVLHPNSETIWADICLLNQKSESKWTDKDALQIEARILIATAPPLCLDPNPHLTRIANSVLRVSTPAVPVSLKRKASVLDPEEDETDKVRRAKIMQFMNPRPNRSHVPSYRLFDTVEKVKAILANRPSPPPPNNPSNNPPLAPFVPPPPATLPNVTTATAASDDSKKKTKASRKNTNASQPTYPSTEPAPQHVPPQMIMSHYPTKTQKQHQTQIPPQPNGQSHVFAANLQNGSGDTSKRVASPAQFAQTPQMAPSQVPPHQQHPQAAAMAAFQPQTTHFVNTTAPGRNPQGKPSNGSAPTTQQQQPQQPTAAQIQHMYAQQAAAASAQQQRLSQSGIQNGNNNGRSTPQQQPSPYPSATRSPATTSRSPMVQNAQSMPQQMTHPAQHITFQNQYNAHAHLRPVAHTNSGSPRPQSLPSHLVNGASAQSTSSPGGPQGQRVPAQDQGNHPQPMMAQYTPMYSYPQMGMNYPMQAGRIPPGYPWPPMRAIPGVVNGQHMAGMAPQPLGVGKAVPGNLQR